jgi:ATP/ADP translocase
MTQLAASSTNLIKSAIPKASLILAASSTALYQNPSYNNSDSDEEKSSVSDKKKIMSPLSPRARSCISMAAAMALHFGGYEFARSGALALFTSSEIGFSHPSAYPFAIGLVTPFSLVLLYWYGLVLKAQGPRSALKTTTMISIVILTLCTVSLKAVESYTSAPQIISKGIVALLFIFQNSYAHLLYTQQWSFLGSVMTPSEGTRWFSAIAGLSSLVCTMTATMVHKLAAAIGIRGLLLGTSCTLTLSLFLADYAYKLGEDCGFDPKDVRSKQSGKQSETKEEEEEEKSLLSKTGDLFRRVPTLAALFGEVIAFQSLSTVLNVCFVRQLKEQMPQDTARASFSGRFYAYVNGTSGLMQFFVLPLARKYLEPQWVYRLMPVLLLPWLVYASLQTSSLWISAAAFFNLKTLDYSLRNVVNEMVYQPLDFE